MKWTLGLIVIIGVVSCAAPKKKILVFSKTEGFRHTSIEAGVLAIQKLGQDQGLAVTATEDSSYFSEAILQEYAAVIFLNTTGDILNYEQQADFERYIQAGGGFVGIHAATDTEYDWPWYNDLVGAYFESHPKVQDASLYVTDGSHISTQGLDSIWSKSDEWYNFRDINPNINVLMRIDEDSYEGGTNGTQHPISWYHEYDGGRSFYTEMGHTDETFENPTFLKHLLGGIEYAIGDGVLNYDLTTSDRVPPENRFIKNVLDFNLNEPMEIDELPGRGILFVERRGALKLYDFETLQTRKLADLDVFYGNEDGLLGIAIDPNFETNNWIYLFYSAPGDDPIQHVSRFNLEGDNLNLDSEKILLKIPTIRKCCHSGGALEFGPKGNLFITLGDNTNPFESQGFAPIDERPGRALWDAQKSASNTNDLRGKILRIKPEDDGTYSIPEGNLFPVGTPDTRPEIYVMGCRNPFRHSIDSKTGYLYWGDVGPDAGKDVEDRGPKGMGEFDQARTAGFWGWPYTRGNNQAYNDYNFIKEESGLKFDPNNIINNSPHNTGIQTLPPVQNSMIWFSYDRSEEFPWIGKGGVNPMAGPVYHADDQPDAEQSFPAYFEDKLFVYEWMRDWIYVVTLDENYNYVKADPFMPETEFSHPMDMLFGSDGNLYTLEYGQKWNSQNLDARLSSITYVSGNRKPVAKIKSDRNVGAAPLEIQFSAHESIDYDEDQLSYQWSFTNDEVQSTDVNPSYTFTNDGMFDVRLTVTDQDGKSSEVRTSILVGNDPPNLSIQIEPQNEIYWDNKEVKYQISVTDQQDGSTDAGTIDPNLVTVTLDYIPEGKDLVKATIGHQQNVVPEGLKLIEGSDCKACHAQNEKVNGPSYNDIAEKYSKKDRAALINGVIKGSVGTWGETMMSAHPQLSIDEVGTIIDYILSFKEDKIDAKESLPLTGVLKFQDHMSRQDEGIYVLMASYRDKGNEQFPASELSVRNQVVFRRPKLELEDAIVISEGVSTWNTGGQEVLGSIVDGSYILMDTMSFEGLKAIQFSAHYNADYSYEGIVEVREASPTGKLLGSTTLGYFNKKKGKTIDSNIRLKSSKFRGPLCLNFKNERDQEQYICNANWILLDYNQ